MKTRIISTCLFIAYSAILIKVMVFKDLPVINIGGMIFKFGGTHVGPANLVPFRTILLYLHDDNGLIAAVNILGNIAILIPIGLLVPFVFRNMTWKKAMVVAIAAGLVLEGMQAVLRVGIFDIDDMILNGFGVMIGYSVFRLLSSSKIN